MLVSKSSHLSEMVLQIQFQLLLLFCLLDISESTLFQTLYNIMNLVRWWQSCLFHGNWVSRWMVMQVLFLWSCCFNWPLCFSQEACGIEQAQCYTKKGFRNAKYQCLQLLVTMTWFAHHLLLLVTSKILPHATQTVYYDFWFMCLKEGSRFSK